MRDRSTIRGERREARRFKREHGMRVDGRSTKSLLPAIAAQKAQKARAVKSLRKRGGRYASPR